MNFQKPTLVHVVAWMTLTSGIVNLFWGFAASGTALATLVGIVCIPFTVLPTILGIFELIYAARLISNPPQVLKPSMNIAYFEIACVLAFNVFSMAVGILALVFYNDAEVRNFFAKLNGTLAPAPASSPTPQPAPAIEEPISPPEDDSQQTPRKVA